VENVANKLMEMGYNAKALHGDISQNQRERILNRFRNKRINVLVATDVAARGIDINDLTHVINYALPHDPESYVHRIGRTGRAGKEGTAITFVTPEDQRRLHFIKRIAKTNIRREKLPEIKDVINAKVTRIKREIEDIIESGSHQDYIKIAKELLEENEAEKVLAALLNRSFKDELNKREYSGVQDALVESNGSDNNRRARRRNRTIYKNGKNGWHGF